MASPDIIKTHAIEFKAPDNNLRELLTTFPLKESTGMYYKRLYPSQSLPERLETILMGSTLALTTTYMHFICLCIIMDNYT